MSGAGVRAVIATLVVCASYYAAGVIGIALRFEPGGISGIWLPHGILVAALLTAPIRRWWLYVVALLPCHLHVVSAFQGPVPLEVMLIQFGGTIGQAVVAAVPLRRILGVPPQLDSISRMGAFLAVAAFLTPLVFSALVASLFVAVGWVDDFLIAWQRRSFTVMCGAAIIAAPIVDLTTGGLANLARASLRRHVELMLITAGLTAALLAPFVWEPASLYHLWFLFVPLPLLLWSAVRFGLGAFGLHMLAVSLVTLANTKAGRSPFAAGSPAEAVLGMQIFLLVISIPLMLLAALVRQHGNFAATLRQSQAQYRSVVEDQTELICRFLSDGTYTFVNGAYCRYFHSSPDELIGKKFWEFLPPHEREASRALLASITPTHPVASIECEVTAPGGQICWQQWTDRGFFDERGHIIEYQAVGHDITERKRAEEDRRQLLAQTKVAEALREVDRRKDVFLAMLAHELRNPLSSIVVAAEIIRITAPADETVMRARDMIARQSAQLTRLVNDLLDVSRLTLGKITLKRSVLDLAAVVAQAVEATQPLFTARNHALVVDVPTQRLPILGDGARLTQVVSNLLNNAAKFTPDGGRIEVRLRQVDSKLVLTVADNGDGIPAHMLERVFDMFMQLRDSGHRSGEGLGIGLALVKRLVEMHDGEIEARSDGPGQGAELVVRLLVAADQTDAAAPREPLVSASPRRARILVVDDNPDAAESLSRLLRLQDHEVVVTHDGLEALATAQSMNPDIILLDLDLPKLDGLEVARRLRLDDGPQALLIAITGFGQAEDRARTAAAGFDHHLTKPIDPQVLYSLLCSKSGQ